MRHWDGLCGAAHTAGFKNNTHQPTSGLGLFAATGQKTKGKKRMHGKRKLKGEMQEKDAFRAAEREKMNQPPPPRVHPCISRHWFIILISLISTVVPIFQMSFSNLCQTVWPFFLIQLMTSLVARWICNSDWVFYRRSCRHTRVFVCLSLSASAQYFGENNWEPSTPGEIGFAAKYVPQGYRTIILS